uniref:Uncharacterized protein n=1 Tax=Nelumbo nucifera TaxID=4432 RepID=A0A822YXS5_NELNU|nr:TPA_asm: hypothetical protein HUJ06_006749 [Nelumbo nucifera]
MTIFCTISSSVFSYNAKSVATPNSKKLSNCPHIIFVFQSKKKKNEKIMSVFVIMAKIICSTIWKLWHIS